MLDTRKKCRLVSAGMCARTRQKYVVCGLLSGVCEAARTSTFNIPRAQHTRTPATHNAKLVDVPRGVGRQ